MYYHNFACIVFEYFNLPALDSYNNFRFNILKISEIINFIARQKEFFFKTMDFQSLYITLLEPELW